MQIRGTYRLWEGKGVSCAEADAGREIAVFFVGGLGDTMFGLPYVSLLMETLPGLGVSCVSVRLRSMPHYGLYTLDDDVQDVRWVFSDVLSKYKRIFYIGHSTGCQVLLRCLDAPPRPGDVYVLQGPVSDREHEEAANSALQQQLLFALSVISSDGDKVAQNIPGKENADQILPFRHNGEYIRADRFVDLFLPGGAEDFFSLDQDTSPLNPCAEHIYFVLSERDEYVHAETNLISNHLRGIRGVSDIFTVDADHCLKGKEAVMLEIILEVISRHNLPNTNRAFP